MLLASIAAIGMATLVPLPSSPRPHDPFCFMCGDLATPDAVLNVLLFMPLGLALALGRVRFVVAFALVIGLTASIEFTQSAFIAGRFGGITDVVTNTLGGWMGFVSGRNVRALVRPTARNARRLAIGWLAGWMAVQFIASFATTSFPTDEQYYRHFRPRVAGMTAFRGQVISASVGDQPLAIPRLDNTDAIRRLLLDPAGVRIAAEVTYTGDGAPMSPVFRVTDESQRVILAVDQLGHDVSFALRAGAQALKLRPYRFLLRDAMTPSAHGNVHVRFDGRFTPTNVTLSATRDASTRTDVIAPRLASAWRLFLPFDTSFNGGIGQRIIDALWMVLLILPMGYWLAYAPASSQEVAWKFMIAAAVVTSVTLMAIPLLTGGCTANGVEVGATSTGMLAGWAVAAVIRRRAEPQGSTTAT